MHTYANATLDGESLQPAPESWEPSLGSPARRRHRAGQGRPSGPHLLRRRTGPPHKQLPSATAVKRWLLNW